MSGCIPTVLRRGKTDRIKSCCFAQHSSSAWWGFICSYLPVNKGAEDDDTQDAEGQDVDDVGQEHLPFAVQAVLTLLITDGSQRRDCWGGKQSDNFMSSEFWYWPSKKSQKQKWHLSRVVKLTRFLKGKKRTFITFHCPLLLLVICSIINN